MEELDSAASPAAPKKKYARDPVLRQLSNAAYRERNRERLNRQSEEWRKAHPEKVAEVKRNWVTKNYEHHLRKCEEWRKANPEKRKEICAKWARANGDKICASVNRRNAKKRMAHPLWANDDLIAKMYEAAALKTLETGVEWHVDHIVPIRSSLVCGLHCEANLQLLPGRENQSKGNRFWPDMP